MVKILADTSVVIELLGDSPAGANLHSLARRLPQDAQHLYSAMTRLELGMGGHRAASKVEALCSVMRSIPIDDAVARIAGGIVAKVFNKKRRQIPDAVIAASAIREDAWLWTLNEKDFKNIDGLRFFSMTIPRQLSDLH